MDITWDKVRRIVEGLTLPSVWPEPADGSEMKLMIASSNYCQQPRGSVMVQSCEETTHLATRITHILPSTPVRILPFVPCPELAEHLQSWTEFVQVYGECVGMVAIYKSRIGGQTSWYNSDVVHTRASVRIFDQDYLQPYLQKIKANKVGEEIDIPYLLNVVPHSDLYELMRKSSPIIRACDHDGPYTINRFIARSYPGQTPPFVRGMLYINAPSNGLGTPFHRGKSNVHISCLY